MRIGKAINNNQRPYCLRLQTFSPLLASMSVISLLLFAQGRASAQTTDTTLGQGIGTSVADVYGDASNVQINTSVASVTYSNPTRIQRAGLNYFEVTGTIRGTGWGGEWSDLTGPAPVLSANGHYSYDVPFVLRWPQNWKGTLVYYSHGRFDLGLLAFVDGFLGADNEGRRMEGEGKFVSDAVLMPDRGYAFFAANLNGLKRDGAFSITALDGQFTGRILTGDRRSRSAV